jgi:hypothetical protein
LSYRDKLIPANLPTNNPKNIIGMNAYIFAFANISNVMFVPAEANTAADPKNSQNI